MASSNSEQQPKVAFVVQRCGREVVGGAEMLCLNIAQHMQQHWDVEILTTCALDYMTWENYYPEGTEKVGHTAIRRFPVDRPRDVQAFNALSDSLRAAGEAASLDEQKAWMAAQGPMSTPLLTYLSGHGKAYDAVLFFGYLYATTYFGLPLVKDRSYLVPLAHDEWTIYFSMWNDFFRLPTGFIFQTNSEREFVQSRFATASIHGPVIGTGVERPQNTDAGRFREKYRIEGSFLLYVGRIDESKGCGELFDLYRAASPPAALVLIGVEVMPVPFSDKIIYLGRVSESDKWDAMAAADWLVAPSPYESLSIALLEAWAVGCPALVNAKCAVLKEHCVRSNGGLWYDNAAELLTMLTSIDDTTRRQLGQHGRNYVEQHYSWPRVVEMYQRVLNRAERAVVSDSKLVSSERKAVSI